MSPQWLGQKWLMLVRAEVEPEKEVSWNRWYDESHLPEVRACPGFLAAARYLCDGLAPLSGYEPLEGSRREYLSVYFVDGPEVLSTEQHQTVAGWGEFAPYVRHEARLYRPVRNARS